MGQVTKEPFYGLIPSHSAVYLLLGQDTKPHARVCDDVKLSYVSEDTPQTPDAKRSGETGSRLTKQNFIDGYWLVEEP